MNNSHVDIRNAALVTRDFRLGLASRHSLNLSSFAEECGLPDKTIFPIINGIRSIPIVHLTGCYLASLKYGIAFTFEAVEICEEYLRAQ